MTPLVLETICDESTLMVFTVTLRMKECVRMHELIMKPVPGTRSPNNAQPISKQGSFVVRTFLDLP